MENQIWPFEVKMHRGMSCEELEMIAGNCGWRFPALYWVSEIYGYRNCWRKILNWPKLLPIPVSTDHGVALDKVLRPFDRELSSNVHLVWSDYRSSMVPRFDNKRIIQVKHPWIGYKERSAIKMKRDAHGTLVFYAHTIPTSSHEPYDLDEYLELLHDLPKEMHPIVICLHLHDVNKGFHEILIDKGVEVVTAGNVWDDLFVDRFYDLASSFKYATSTVVGSHSFYVTNLGLDFFLYGRPHVSVHTRGIDMPLEHGGREYVVSRCKEVFDIPGSTVAKQSFANQFLGIHSSFSYEELCSVFKKEMLEKSVEYWRLLSSNKKLVDYLIEMVQCLNDDGGLWGRN